MKVKMRRSGLNQFKIQRGPEINCIGVEISAASPRRPNRPVDCHAMSPSHKEKMGLLLSFFLQRKETEMVRKVQV